MGTLENGCEECGSLSTYLTTGSIDLVDGQFVWICDECGNAEVLT